MQGNFIVINPYMCTVYFQQVYPLYYIPFPLLSLLLPFQTVLAGLSLCVYSILQSSLPLIVLSSPILTLILLDSPTITFMFHYHHHLHHFRFFFSQMSENMWYLTSLTFGLVYLAQHDDLQFCPLAIECWCFAEYRI
jgi:hypothetical protein